MVPGENVTLSGIVETEQELMTLTNKCDDKTIDSIRKMVVDERSKYDHALKLMSGRIKAKAYY